MELSYDEFWNGAHKQSNLQPTQNDTDDTLERIALASGFDSFEKLLESLNEPKEIIIPNYIRSIDSALHKMKLKDLVLEVSEENKLLIKKALNAHNNESNSQESPS